MGCVLPTWDSDHTWLDLCFVLVDISGLRGSLDRIKLLVIRNSLVYHCLRIALWVGGANVDCALRVEEDVCYALRDEFRGS